VTGLTIGALLLVVGPIAGAVAVGSFPWRAWLVPREEHLAIVAAHRTGWTLVNGGFLAATVTTAAGIFVVALAQTGDAARTAAVTAEAVGYTVAGTLWCAVLAIRHRTTPVLADLVAAARSTEPAEALLGALNGGLFGAFVLTTGVALVALSVTLALAGGVAPPVAWLAAILAAVPIAMFIRTGDTIPATLYLPTTLIGVALLAGWT
jgi:hypothetical protein